MPRWGIPRRGRQHGDLRMTIGKRTWVGLVMLLGGFAVGCSSTSSDDGSGSSPNLMAGTTAVPTAGTPGTAGTTGPTAGTTGPAAGSTGTAGTTGEGGMCTNEGEI